jgi:hypothetical protein
MKKNMGSTDRTIRAVLGIAAILIALFATSGAVDIILYVFAAIMILTSIIGICPLYIPFHISTRK